MVVMILECIVCVIDNVVCGGNVIGVYSVGNSKGSVGVMLL